MTKLNGWIALDRGLLEWEWFQDPLTVQVWLYLLLTANWQETRYKGHVIPRGSGIIGRQKLAQTLNCGEQALRSALTRLKSTGSITTQPTNKFTIYHIVKYDDYQNGHEGITSESTNKPTNQQPTTNQQLTTPKQSNKGTREQEEYVANGDDLFPKPKLIDNITPIPLKPPKPKSDPRVAEFRSYFVEQWKAKYGSEPYWKFGHYEKLMKSLLGWADQNGGVEKLKEAVQEFMASADEKVLDSRHSFAWFHATLNTWTVKRKTWMDKFDEKFGGQK